MDDAYGPRNHEHNLRPRRPRDYSHLHSILESIVLTQYDLKRGIQVFGEAAVKAVLLELQNLHDRKVMVPRNANELSATEKRAALDYLMFLKEKRNGLIKDGDCVDGRKQRSYITKEESSSPTVAIECVLKSCMIDAHERRNVAVVDIPGAFTQADMEDLYILSLFAPWQRS
jgi:hypothetical protein